MTARRTLALLTVLALAGCGGGGSAPTSAPPPAAVAPVPANGPTSTGKVVLSFAQAGPAVTARKPKFVSPGAKSAGVGINGGAQTFFDVSATSTLCTTTAGVRVCSLPFTAPVGQAITFSVTLYDLANGGGTILGQGTNATTVVLGTPFQVAVGVNPQIAGGSVALSSTSFNYGNGMTQTITATFTFMDPSGATITGSGNVPNFLQPVTLTSSDPNITISPSTLTTPGQTATVSYNGSTAVGSLVSFSAAVSGVPLGTQAISIPGLFVTRFDRGAPGAVAPSQMVVGPDSKIWWAEKASSTATSKIARIDPAVGASSITTFPTGFATGQATGIAVGCDGNIWYSNGGLVIGRMAISGGVPATGPQFITVSGAGGQVTRLMADSQGNVWYLNIANTFSQVAYVNCTTFAVNTFGATPSSMNSLGFASSLILGQDNAMWFTENNNGIRKIGRITTPANGTAGTYTEYPIANTSATVFPWDIAAGPDGNIWFGAFANTATNQFFASFNPATPNSITEYPNSVSGVNPAVFANYVTMFRGADGNMWIAEGGGALKIPPALPQLTVTEFFQDNAQNTMVNCLSGPDNNLWCTVIGSGPNPGFNPTNDGIITWKPR